MENHLIFMFHKLVFIVCNVYFVHSFNFNICLFTYFGFSVSYDLLILFCLTQFETPRDEIKTRTNDVYKRITRGL